MRLPGLADVNRVLRDATLLVDGCDEHGVVHLAGCGILFLNGSPCSCGLPSLRNSLRTFERRRAHRNLAAVEEK